MPGAGGWGKRDGEVQIKYEKKMLTIRGTVSSFIFFLIY